MESLRTYNLLCFMMAQISDSLKTVEPYQITARLSMLPAVTPGKVPTILAEIWRSILFCRGQEEALSSVGKKEAATLRVTATSKLNWQALRLSLAFFISPQYAPYFASPNRGISMAGHLSMTTFSPASLARTAACSLITPSCSHRVLAPMAIAS